VSGFRARNLRFCSVREIGVLDERILWYLRVRHVLGLLFSMFLIVAAGWKVIAFSAAIAFSIFLASVYPSKSMGLTSLVFGAFRYALTSKKERVQVRICESEVRDIEKQKGVDRLEIGKVVKSPSVESFASWEEDSAAGLATREVAARKSGRIREIR